MTLARNESATILKMDDRHLPTPHNNFFHFALSSLPAARSLIETQLSTAALLELNLETLKLETGSFVDPDLHEKFSDLLMSVDLSGSNSLGRQQAYVYFLFEHKSEAEPLTALQLLSYIVRIWEKRIRDSLPLCPIIPLVVYHGEREWSVARSIEELISAPAALSRYQVQFGFPLLDLSEMSDEEIEGEPILQSTLRLLKYGRSRELPSKLRQILELVANSASVGGIAGWIQAIGVYVMAVNKEIGSEELKRIVQSVFPTQIEPGSLADRLLTQGRQEGLEQGLERGLEQGLERGLEQGMERGKLTGKIQTLQELVGYQVTPDEELRKQSINDLVVLIQDLQERLRNRDT